MITPVWKTESIFANCLIKDIASKNKIMGKAANIKRAKRLKDAKRKREQDALLAAGIGPSGVVIQKRAALAGDKITINQDKVKYSELLTELVTPILSAMDDINVVKVKYIFAVHAWNAAVMKAKNGKFYQSAKNELVAIIPDVPEIGELFDEMVKRKEDEFPTYKNIIVDFEIRKIRGIDYNVTVATIPFQDAQASSLR